MAVPNQPGGESKSYNDIDRFFDLSFDLLAVISNGRFVRANPAWERVLGYSLDELRKTPIYDLIHPADVEPTKQLRDRIHIEGEAVEGFQNRYRCKDGTYRWLEWSARRFPNEQLSYCIARDITDRKQAEDTLNQREQTVSALLDGLPSYAAVMRPDGTILSINRRTAAFFNQPADDLIGQNYLTLATEDNVNQERKAWIRKAVETRKQFTVEFERNGTFLESTITPVVDQEGEVVAVVASSHDVTSFKRAEAALRQSEQTLRGLLDSLPYYAFMMDLSGALLAINQRYADFLGKPPEEIIGRSVYEVTAVAEFTSDRIAWMQEVVQSGQPASFESQNDGRYYETTVTPVYNNQGELTTLVVSTHDITHLKQTEIALRKSEEQFRSVLESAAEGILVTDRVGDIVLVNRAVERQFGYSRDELIGSPVDILLPEALRKGHFRHRKHFVAKPAVRPMAPGRALVGRRKDGSLFPVEVSLSYTHIDDMLVMAFIVDVSERKQMEQERLEHERFQAEMKKEREIIELRQQFMSMISHEFRTPLTAIASSCEILDHYHDRLNDEQRKERIRGLNAHVHTMVRLLDDILMLNKIQAGMTEFKPEAVDPHALSQRVIDTARLVDQQQHQLQFRASHVPDSIQADRRILEHILTNLLSNAIKYSPPGTQVDFQLHSARDKITFVIRDEGVGIPEADQPNLFKPFHRARNVGETQGTGLGLAIVKSNVELHGGEIRFQSAEGKGTTFWVDIPLSPPLLS